MKDEKPANTHLSSHSSLGITPVVSIQSIDDLKISKDDLYSHVFRSGRTSIGSTNNFSALLLSDHPAIIIVHNNRLIKIKRNSDVSFTASEANKRFRAGRGVDFTLNPGETISSRIMDPIERERLFSWIESHLYTASCSPQGRRRLKSKKVRSLKRVNAFS